MKTLLIAALAALIIFLFPYIRVIFKRVSLGIRIKKLCADGRVKLHKTRPLWLFGLRIGKKCDFCLETAGTIRAVKLFEMKSRRSELILTDDSEYIIRNYIAFAAGMFSRIPVDSAKKPLSIDFRHDFHDEWYGKRFVPVLLVHPVCMQINYQSKSEQRIISAGETVNEMYIASLSKLISDIEKEVQNDRTAFI